MVPSSEDVAEDVATASDLSNFIEAHEKSLSSSSTATNSRNSEEEINIMSTNAWVWSGLRDHRLGRIVAANHYNMQKAAEALSQEFMCKVSAQECRRRYTELKKLQDSDKVDKPIEEIAKKDASQWWLRQLDKAREAAEVRRQKVEEMRTKGPLVRVNEKAEREEPSLYYDLAGIEAEMERVEAAEKAKTQASARASSASGMAGNVSAAATSSLLSAPADADPSSLIKGLGPAASDSSSPSHAKVEPCRIPRAFAPPARSGKPSELGQLD